jgi:hypothetical protein
MTTTTPESLLEPLLDLVSDCIQTLRFAYLGEPGSKAPIEFIDWEAAVTLTKEYGIDWNFRKWKAAQDAETRVELMVSYLEEAMNYNSINRALLYASNGLITAKKRRKEEAYFLSQYSSPIDFDSILGEFVIEDTVFGKPFILSIEIGTRGLEVESYGIATFRAMIEVEMLYQGSHEKANPAEWTRYAQELFWTILDTETHAEIKRRWMELYPDDPYLKRTEEDVGIDYSRSDSLSCSG